jgi:hypothetical protein
MSEMDKDRGTYQRSNPQPFTASVALQVFWVFLGLVLLAVSLTPVIDGDGAARFSDLLNLAKGERPIDKFSSVQLFLSMPLYYAGGLFAAAQAFVGYFNFSIFVLTAVALWFLLEKDQRFFVVLLLLSASMFPHHLRYYYGEVLSVCLITVGLLCLLKNKKVVAALLLGLGGAQVPALLPALALVLCYVSFRKRNIWYLFYMLLPVLLMAADNWLKYQTLLPSAYLQAGERGEKTLMPYSGLPGFSYPIIFGLLSILFSFGKGLIFFVPALFLRKKLQPATTQDIDAIYVIDVFLVFSLGLLLTYARWYGWYGGQFWGPRFFLFTCVPAAMILAFYFTRMQSGWSLKLLFACATLLSGWVCVQGYLYGNQHLAICGENKSQLELLCWYVPEFSPIFREFVVGFSSVPQARMFYVTWCVLSVLLILGISAFKTKAVSPSR